MKLLNRSSSSQTETLRYDADIDGELSDWFEVSDGVRFEQLVTRSC